ncbi:MAG: class I SAM-dependent methyltransferase, partial [Patescibacteria group bacterium]
MPEYYEIAFSFVNPKKQIDFFEKLIKSYSKRRVKRFLDIACGPSLQLREIAKRGYEAIGLDLSKKMINYVNQKAKEEKIKIETINADMTKFRLKKKADFAFIMMGSLSYIKNNQDFLNHLNSVASSLNKGALYFIENYRLDWTTKGIFSPTQCTIKK